MIGRSFASPTIFRIFRPLPSYRTTADYGRPPLQRRASGLALALGVNLLVVLALIGIGSRPLTTAEPSGTTIVELIADSPAPAAPAARPRPRSASSRGPSRCASRRRS
jgi:hypothetical protein